MTVIEVSTYRCSTCDQVVPAPTSERPVEMLSGSSGHANEWVVNVGNVEIHRCTFVSGPAPLLVRLGG